MATNPPPNPALQTLAGKPAKKSGRPPKLTPELIEKIADVVRAGNYIDTAAVFCGVSKASLHDWMKRGHEQKRGRYRDFLDAMEQAQATADVRDHANITKAGGRDWRASAEHLRLRHPNRYAKKTVDVGNADGKAFGVTVTDTVEASLLSVMRKLADGGSDDDEG
jgi:hypothetical protein